METTNEIKVTSQEYKKAVDFMSNMHSSILKAKDLKSSLIQKGMISDTIRSLAVLGFAIFAI